MRMRILTFLLLALAKSISGCGSPSPTTVSRAPNVGGTWVPGYPSPTTGSRPPNIGRTWAPGRDATPGPNVWEETPFGKLESTLIDALRGSKKR